MTVAMLRRAGPLPDMNNNLDAGGMCELRLRKRARPRRHPERYCRRDRHRDGAGDRDSDRIGPDAAAAGGGGGGRCGSRSEGPPASLPIWM